MSTLSNYNILSRHIRPNDSVTWGDGRNATYCVPSLRTMWGLWLLVFINWMYLLVCHDMMHAKQCCLGRLHALLARYWPKCVWNEGFYVCFGMPRGQSVTYRQETFLQWVSIHNKLMLWSMHSVFGFGMDIKPEVSKWGFGPKNV